uniref:Uncharacterized protein n=1 Tax=Physcomitrium patens TaxID=3218 RepID=A0A2K1IHP0_PHYPA|nr:hypothetical protein PHYPA_027485 [Physcomitrium patens]
MEDPCSLVNRLGLSVRDYQEKQTCYVTVVVVPKRGKERVRRLSLVNWMALVTLAMSRATPAGTCSLNL